MRSWSISAAFARARAVGQQARRLQGRRSHSHSGALAGSTCFLVTGAGKSRYLFTGDAVYLGDTGEWTAGFIPGVSDAKVLASSLKLLATLGPDLVISSAFVGDGAHTLGGARWSACVDQAATAYDRNLSSSLEREGERIR